MNKLKKLYYLLMFLPLFYTIICLFFLPDIIPMHYNGANEVDRMGSKYEILIIPFIIIFFGYFMLILGKSSSKKEKEANNNNEKVTIITGMCSLAIFHIINIFMLYSAFHSIKNLKELPVDLFKLLFTAFGLIFVVIGNYLPKCKMNSIVGLRTVWSMKNEKTWKESQRLGGISFIITGIVMTAGNLLFFSDVSCLIFSMILMGIDLIFSIIISYYAAKKYA
ncbi:SdpI family protein [Anaerocolumna sp. AGMB13020]|uniref:SdpI family protein n=1 Tax=Anaerocolumna sp. AGMB13020 TaxID=3081750 RepID=UPI002952DECE|nr:SdpI family protein [Anaerocolumna sp. AGMB13020]WOO36851.1 SdpI family protein [Anaerocolumna sp. AGMB13020]